MDCESVYHFPTSLTSPLRHTAAPLPSTTATTVAKTTATRHHIRPLTVPLTQRCSYVIFLRLCEAGYCLSTYYATTYYLVYSCDSSAVHTLKFASQHTHTHLSLSHTFLHRHTHTHHF